MGPETSARPRPPGCFHPPLGTRAQGPWLTCDGAVVIVPRDPGQPHTPLRQVGELQVPGSVWPSWQQREKTPRRTPELGPARPRASPSPGHVPRTGPRWMEVTTAGIVPSLPWMALLPLRGSRKNEEVTDPNSTCPLPERVSKGTGHRESSDQCIPFPKVVLENTFH